MTARESPKVSIITPTYQRRELVKQAVASALAQTYRDFELIVVDDGSTDGTGEALEALAHGNGRLRYRWQPNRGVAAARNAGLRLARGSIVAFLDSDDRWFPDHLEVVTEVLEGRPEAVLVSTCPNFFVEGDQRACDADLVDHRDKLLSDAAGAGYVPCIAVRREALLAAGGFDERLKVMEDSDLLRRLATLGPFALVRRRTVVTRPTSARDRARRASDYLAAAELTAGNLASAVDRLPQHQRSQLSAEVRAVAHLSRAMRALERADDAALKAELEGACRGLPLSYSPVMVTHRLRCHVPRFHRSREERLRVLQALVEAWPDRHARTARYVRLWAVAVAVRLGRPRDAARLLAGWRLRGTARFARKIVPVLQLFRLDARWRDAAIRPPRWVNRRGRMKPVDRGRVMLPNLIIIGAGKCGTSSLYYYLRQHPEITMSKEKELNFFVFMPRWMLGVEWYEAQFDGASTPVRGEASPQYTNYPRKAGVAERMRAVIPEARLIYVVRDPIERIVSAYMDAYAERREEEPLAEVITPLDGNPYVCDSSYHMQLEQFLRHYPSERILVISREELLRERRATLRRVFGFLGVDTSFDSPRFDEIRNPSSELRRIAGPRFMPRKMRPNPTGRLPWGVRAPARRIIYAPFSRRVERPELEPELREALAEHLKPEVDRLRRLTGMAFPEWSI